MADPPDRIGLKNQRVIDEWPLMGARRSSRDTYSVSRTEVSQQAIPYCGRNNRFSGQAAGSGTEFRTEASPVFQPLAAQPAYLRMPKVIALRLCVSVFRSDLPCFKGSYLARRS